MPAPTFLEGRDAGQFGSRRILLMALCTSLMAFAWIEPTAAIAQAPSSTAPPSVGMGVTSSLSARSAAVPLGATEIATPGISPVVPLPGTTTSTCAGSDGAGPSGTFDGGGNPGSTPLSCADSRFIPSPLPSASSIGAVGIPLGATEIGGAGTSSAAPVAGPGLSGSSASAGGSTITNSGNP